RGSLCGAGDDRRSTGSRSSRLGCRRHVRSAPAADRAGSVPDAVSACRVLMGETAPAATAEITYAAAANTTTETVTDGQAEVVMANEATEANQRAILANQRK